MTCKDCIHEKVCDALIKSGCPYLDEEVPADAFCMEFRNTADVVPKSESEFDSIPVEVAQVLKDKAVEKAKADVAREIFEEIEKTFIDSAALPDCARFVDIDKIAELKKKYT